MNQSMVPMRYRGSLLNNKGYSPCSCINNYLLYCKTMPECPCTVVCDCLNVLHTGRHTERNRLY